MQTNKYKYSRFLLHILIWSLLAYILFRYPHTVRREVPLPQEFVIKQIVHMGIMLIAYYFNAHYLVPKFLIRKRYLRFVIAVLLFTLLAAFFMSFVSRSLDLHTKEPFTNIPAIWNRLYLDRFASWTTLIVLGISTLLSIMGKWSADSARLERLEREQIQTELSALRAQIHPHFLFNTLNSVYALSYIDSDASRKALAQVSRLLRYQLYEVQRSETTLDKELAFVKDYVNIMQLRVNEKINVELRLPQEIGDLGIAPMILMCYIENVFKHGVGDETEGNMLIAIEQTGNTLTLTTKNKIAAVPTTTKNEGSTGIGMQNTQRRLELLYPGRHELSTNVDTDNNEFELRLTLQLT